MIIKENIDEIFDYLSDESQYQGKAEILYIPENTEELEELVKKLYKKKQPFTISGARTGLVGGAVPHGGAIISMEKLNKIIQIDTPNKKVICQPAVKLVEIKEAVAIENLFYPPDPTEQNSSIGGNLSTNASGARTFKYGPTRTFVSAIKLLLTNGDKIYLKRGEVFAKDNRFDFATVSGKQITIDLPKLEMPNIKHAAGYFIKDNMDLIDLIIGSEGTFGIVYEIELDLLENVDTLISGLVFFNDKSKMMEFVKDLRTRSNNLNQKDYKINTEISSRILEYFDKYALELLKEKHPQIPDNIEAAIWFEQETITENEDELMNKWYEYLSDYTDLVDETWLGTDDLFREKLRAFRHDLPLSINEVLSKGDNYKISTDTAVPEEHFEEYFAYMENLIQSEKVRYIKFGHIGNCHLHANMFLENNSQIGNKIYMKLIKKALSFGGTVSAEHGIGNLKRKYLYEMYGQDKMDQLKSIKLIFDPENLLNNDVMFINKQD